MEVDQRLEEESSLEAVHDEIAPEDVEGDDILMEGESLEDD